MNHEKIPLHSTWRCITITFVCLLQFRLRHCGLKHPIYLVEDYGSIQHMSLPESTLLQAIVNTQVAYRSSKLFCLRDPVNSNYM